MPLPWLLLVSGVALTTLSPKLTCNPAGHRLAWIRATGTGMAVGIALGLLHGASVMGDRLPVACERKPVEATGIVVSLPRISQRTDSQRRQRFEFLPRSVAAEDCAGVRRLLISYYGEKTIEPGQTWRFELLMKRPWGLANPGSYNMQAWYSHTGIDATGSVRAGTEHLVSRDRPWYTFHHRLRQRVAQRLAHTSLTPGAEAVLRAVTVGDKSGMDNALWSLLQYYGINHLLVISGLHVGLIGGTGLLLGAGGRRLLALRVSAPAVALLPHALALLLALGYTALAGFTVAALRALLMLTAVLLGALLWRRTSPWSGLVIAALVILTANPLAALGSGFWLSFSCVALLLWYNRWQPAQSSWWRRGVLTHAYMGLAMLPMGGWFFGGASSIAAVANLLMVPLVGCWVVPLALLGAALCLCGLAPLDDWVWRAAGIPLDMLLPPARAFMNSDTAMPYLHFSAGALPLAAAALGVILAPMPLRRRWRLCLPALFLPLLMPVSGGSAEEGPLDTTVLDVGQGTAVVLRSGQRTLVYDTGGGDPDGANMAHAVVLPFLYAQGVRRVDTLVISHADTDHSAGAGAIISALPVGRVLHGPGMDFPGRGQPCRTGMAWHWGDDIEFQILASGGGNTALSSNAGSCVLQVRAGNSRFLLPGDIDKSREQELVRYWRGALASNVLLAGHHGSNTSTAHVWLKWVDPALVIYTNGYRNQFGHPHPAVTARVKAFGATQLSTARSGAIQLWPGEGEPGWREYRRRNARYWMH